MAASGNNLLDPETFGEDLLAMANRAAELAKVYCEGCAAYHFRYPATRAVGLPEGLSIDRVAIVETIRQIMRPRHHDMSEFSLVIAGAADTGLFATVAHAIVGIDKNTFRQTHFTVMDLCRTPLELCKEFAQRHDITCEVRQGNLLDATPDRPAHLVVMHSVLRFLSPDERIRFIRQAAGWLAPHGRLLISNTFGLLSEQQRAAKAMRKEETLRRIAAAVESGLLQTPFLATELTAAMKRSTTDSHNRHRVFLQLSDFEDLVRAAGLEIVQVSFHEGQGPEAGEERTSRILAVLAPKLQKTLPDH